MRLLIASVLFVGTCFAQLPSKVEGTAVDAKGASVANAEIRISSRDFKVIARARTNRKGGFIVPHVPSGWYLFEATKHGQRTIHFERWVLISVGDNTIKPVLTEKGHLGFQE